MKGWETAFVAMSVALGATVDEACAHLDPETAQRAGAYLRALDGRSRLERARATAAQVAAILVDVRLAGLL